MKYALLLATALFVGAGCASSTPDPFPNGEGQDVAIMPTSKLTPPAPQEDQPAPPAETSPVDTSVVSSTPSLPPTSTTMSTPKILAFPGVLSEKELSGKEVRIKTAKGDIVFELLGKAGPKAASNFVYLANEHFYDGLTFHRIEPGFVIQGGDPNGTGTGGPGYQFEDDAVNLPYTTGIVAMANAGPNTNGSQFFIMLDDWSKRPKFLDPNYSIFGRVIKGMDVVAKIQRGDKMISVTVEPLKK